jgi:phosphoribosylanthranilate isomerase
MQQRTRIKICGLTRAEDIAAAVEAGADALGFVFYPKSPRYVSPQAAAQLIAAVPPFISIVGLFVNTTPAILAEATQQVPLSLLQFHGDESLDTCCALAKAAARPFIRALRISPDTEPDSLLQCEKAYFTASNLFRGILLDTLVDGYGGAGKVFDWSLIPKELAPRAVLSGGLNVHNIAEAILRVRPYAVDVSSGVEREKGLKDADKIHAFVKAVRSAESSLIDRENIHEILKN